MRVCLMISQAACGLLSLREEHSNYPLKLFGILRDRELATLILAEALAKPCTLDEFSKAFVAHHEKRGLASTETVGELFALAVAMELDTAAVEAFHASTRRLATAFFVQTHTENIADASAEWVLRRFRAMVRSAGIDDDASRTAAPKAAGGAGLEGVRTGGGR